jgi:hypothetical protein
MKYLDLTGLAYFWQKIKTIITNKEKVIAAALNDLEKRKANASELAAVATSGSYEDLDGKPDPGVQSVNDETGEVILNIDNLNDSDWDYIFTDETDERTIEYIWVDDWPEELMQDIEENAINSGIEVQCDADYFQYVVNNCMNNRPIANQYHYTGETFEYNGESYLLFELDDHANQEGVRYGLMSPITYTQLFNHTIEYDLVNLDGNDWDSWVYHEDRQPYCPFAHFLDVDMEVDYTIPSNLAYKYDLIAIAEE